MALAKLSYSSIPHLERGVVEALFDRGIGECVDDCRDRPGDPKPRKLTLEVEFVPIVSAQGHADDVRVTMQVRTRVPAQVSRPYEMQMRGKDLAFNPESPDDVHQETIEFGTGEVK